MHCIGRSLQTRRQAHAARGHFRPERSLEERDTSQVIALGADGNQIGYVPRSIVDNGGRTEWIESFYPAGRMEADSRRDVNYGLRFDKFTASPAAPVSPPRERGVAGAAGHHRAWRLCAVSVAAAFRVGGQRDRRQVRETHGRSRGHAGRHAAGGTGQLLRHRRAAKNSAALHGRSRHLLQAIAQSDR